MSAHLLLTTQNRPPTSHGLFKLQRIRRKGSDSKTAKEESYVQCLRSNQTHSTINTLRGQNWLPKEQMRAALVLSFNICILFTLFTHICISSLLITYLKSTSFCWLLAMILGESLGMSSRMPTNQFYGLLLLLFNN
jgi:hypothetical protein